MKIDFRDIDRIIEQEGRERRFVLPILQAIQNKYNYLPEAALRRVCAHTQITPQQIISVASFYTQFRLYEAGEHIIKVCKGTACHVKGSELVYDALSRRLKLKEGEHTDTSGAYTLEKVHCLGCCALAPVVQIDSVTYPHLNSSKAESILSDFEQWSRKKKIRRPAKTVDRPEGEIRITLDSCCVASGSAAVKEAVEKTVAEEGLNVRFKQVSCVGMCGQVPVVEVAPEGKAPHLYARVQAGDIRPILEKHFQPRRLIDRLKVNVFKMIEGIQEESPGSAPERLLLDAKDKQVASFLGHQVPIATEFRGSIDPMDIDEYIRRGGFTALKKCLETKTPAAVVEEVKKSGMRGRGGAGFPTGGKWEMLAAQKKRPKYIICNGDEGDPGAFMDRMLLESYPYRVIEGMLIGAYATGASEGYFYIRAEYPDAAGRIRQALKICLERGWVGENIQGTDFSCRLQVYEGAGAFVCGEETALINSIEGDRGFPRIRPPYPVEEGLWGQPTLVNNTETFAQIPFILQHGAGRFNTIGTASSKGTKVFSLTGKVLQGGLIEVPMGTTIRQIVEDIGGGIPNGRKFKAVQIGGPSGGCLPASLADIPVDYESLREAGAIMGSGGLVVLDDTDCMVDIAQYFLSFTQSESCGKCTFCRIGTKRMADILDRICSGSGKMKDLEELEMLSGWTSKGSLCGLGKTAPKPVSTTLQHFRHEYEEHINGRCPAGKCKSLITYSINEKCIGCTICAQKCPTDAIAFRPHERHEINMELCIRCNNCREVCPYEAVEVQ
ncbi:MAG: NAD(P)H-dependent oxidoreductase subunit E [Phaeodactylibacter sp.]|nr:NAD(P)H-dependent oxidoreductase subunit E [Phaeodactylibacter sp.]MCB9054150.1 NAD(P)H-dependent oxidoreductase subunit E [Lewinellaceae bacterium]